MHHFLSRFMTSHQRSIFWFSTAVIGTVLFLWMQWDAIPQFLSLFQSINWREVLSVFIPALVLLALALGKDALNEHRWEKKRNSGNQ